MHADGRNSQRGIEGERKRDRDRERGKEREEQGERDKNNCVVNRAELQLKYIRETVDKAELQ